MLKKVLYAFILIIILLTIPCEVAFGEDKESPQTDIEDILSVLSNGNIEKFLFDSAENLLTGNEWIVFSVRQYKNGYNFDNYKNSLEKYVKDTSVSSAVTREKIALLLLATGSNSDYPTEIIDSSIGRLGVMSHVFGLNLISNGVSSADYSADDIVEILGELQHNDGGWAVDDNILTNSDVDVTAMVLSALAPYYHRSEESDNLIDVGVEYLAEVMNEDCTFSSMGKKNCESTAMAIVALASMDKLEDDRFQSKDKNLLDGIKSFRLEDNSYSHLVGGNYSFNSTIQALAAFVAVERNRENKSPYYVLDDYVFGEEYREVGDKKSFFENWKFWTISGIVLVGMGVCIFIALKKKGGIIEIITISVLVVGISLFIGLSTFQTVEDYYAFNGIEGETICVNLSIRQDTIMSEKPLIFEGKVYVKKEKGSVFDALEQGCKKEKISFSFSGGGLTSVYVTGIADIYENQYGSQSGWIFAVNNEISSQSANMVYLQEGDNVCWYYTLDLGKDGKNFFGRMQNENS